MCLSHDAYVEARVLQRLLQSGVSPSKARAVARKVRASYEAKRRSAAAEQHEKRKHEQYDSHHVDPVIH